MKSIWKVMLAVCCLGMTIGCGTNPSKNENVKETLPALVVNGTQLMNTEGDTVVLHGVSYGWHQFWPRFYNASSVAYLVNDWGAQVLRASMGVDLDSACYVNKPEFGIECVTKVVDAAIENGVYVIIDWHSHNLRQEEAKEFFTQMATRYKGVPNVIYEVFNEPVEDSWEQVKSYSVEVIKTIRAIEPDAVILVGCPHWDQDIHLAADDPITGYSNIMYTLHFYANTHGQCCATAPTMLWARACRFSFPNAPVWRQVGTAPSVKKSGGIGWSGCSGIPSVGWLGPCRTKTRLVPCFIRRLLPRETGKMQT